MNHQEFSNLLDAFVEGTLPDEAAEQMRSHAAACDACAALLALRQDCRRMDDGIEVPDAFSSAWRQKMEEEICMAENTTKEKPRGGGRWKKWLAAAAALIFVVGGTILFRDDAPRRTGENVTGAAYSANYSAKSSPMAAATGLGASNYAMDTAYEMSDMDMMAESDDAGRAEKIIRSASLSLRTAAYDEDLEKMQALTGQVGGRVEYLSASGDASSGQNRTANLTLRIPAGRLDEFLSGAQEIGTVTSLTQEMEDVSDTYYDVQTRLQTQQAKMQRLQKLMEAAKDVSDLIEIESAIAETQYYIDRYTAQLRGYDSKVDYSTVRVTIREIKIQESVEVSLGQRILSGLQSSLEDGRIFLEDMVIFLVSALPWIVGIGIVTGVIVLIVKKKKRH